MKRLRVVLPSANVETRKHLVSKGARLEDADTGELLGAVMSFSINLDHDGLVTADVNMLVSEIVASED